MKTVCNHHSPSTASVKAKVQSAMGPQKNRAGLHFGPSARGMTILEILIAMLVVMVGFVAIYSLQVVAIEGNRQANDLGRASNLASRWIEILRRDAIGWTTGGPVPQRFTMHDQWRNANAEPVNKDNLMREDDEDLVLDDKFCVWYRVSPVPAGILVDSSLLRVDVRVVWPRGDADWTAFVGCPEGLLAPESLPRVREVTMSSTVGRRGGV